MSSCMTCDFPDSCTSCDASLKRIGPDQFGLCICNFGYFQNGSGICVACFYSCQTCVNSLNCESCNSVDK